MLIPRSIWKNLIWEKPLPNLIVVSCNVANLPLGVVGVTKRSVTRARVQAVAKILRREKVHDIAILKSVAFVVRFTCVCKIVALVPVHTIVNVDSDVLSPVSFVDSVSVSV